MGQVQAGVGEQAGRQPGAPAQLVQSLGAGRVDGGVFDIGPGEVIVPIRAALPVTTPKLFAVTIEKPGGVVVSSRQRIVVTAAPKQG